MMCCVWMNSLLLLPLHVKHNFSNMQEGFSDGNWTNTLLPCMFVREKDPRNSVVFLFGIAVLNLCSIYYN